MRGKPLILKKLDNGCIVPTSHKLNDEKNHCTGTALAALFGVSFSTTCGWIREWKA